MRVAHVSSSCLVDRKSPSWLTVVGSLTSMPGPVKTEKTDTHNLLVGVLGRHLGEIYEASWPAGRPVSLDIISNRNKREIDLHTANQIWFTTRTPIYIRFERNHAHAHSLRKQLHTHILVNEMIMPSFEWNENPRALFPLFFFQLLCGPYSQKVDGEKKTVG
jgi:hypothetical protein